MKTILGLDLGTTSIGWALIREDENQTSFVDMGVRIVPLATDEKEEFTKGNAISKNQKRTQKRTQRKGYDRYQLRRKYLTEVLRERNMLPNEKHYKLSALELYGLRNNALKERLDLEQIGRIFLHLNQKRGYKGSIKEEGDSDKKVGEYVAGVKSRYAKIKELGLTIGQFFYQELQKNQYYRIKEQIFPREAYIEEFKIIYKSQQNYYPNILTDEFLNKLIHEIVYYQRPLKSQKGLVSICEFEGQYRKNKEGKVIFTGPKVAPKSSPISQVCRILEVVNTMKLKSKTGSEFELTNQHRKLLFEYLNENERLTETKLFSLLKLSKNDGFVCNVMGKSGIKGNETVVSVKKALGEDISNWLKFELSEVQANRLIDPETGEEILRNEISSSFELEPLYQLWHALYSIKDDELLRKVLSEKFHLPSNRIESLIKIDFTKQSYSNKSARVMRKIIPFLQSGFLYSDAMAYAGYNHSNSLTGDENLNRELIDKIKPLKLNSLRQPVVEKILNQMINIVNAIIDQYGRPDEIRVELARELKSSKDERNNAMRRNNENEAYNKKIADELIELGVKVNRRNIEKLKLYKEVGGISIYTGNLIPVATFLNGDQVDIEHILPKARIFDDSFQNKTICEQSENRLKGNMTAYDFMKTKSEEEFNNYLERIELLYKKKDGITRAKRDKLLTPADKIPKDFIERQIRQTQYISRKSTEILKSVCRNVYATSGQVTEYLRHSWGWSDVLMQLQVERLKSMGLDDLIEYEMIGKGKDEKKRPVIKGWTKRNDHRHHAIDALTIASTKQTIIQKLNRLNQEVMKNEGQTQSEALKENLKLKDFVNLHKPFTHEQVLEFARNINISFKSGKKVAIYGKRLIRKNGKSKVVQSKIVIPKGALSEESIYGKINHIKNNCALNELFEQPDQIVSDKIKAKVKERLQIYEGNKRKALASLKKEPIWLNEEYDIKLESAAMYQSQFVIKYPISAIKLKDVEFIVDAKVKEIVSNRLAEYNGNHKEAFKDLQNNPVWYNKEKGIEIKTVRCFTGLSNLQPLHTKKVGNESLPLDYVKPGNNHHVSIFEDEKGKLYDIVTTFWEAVERKKNGLPVIVTNHPDGHKFVMSLQQNEMVRINEETGFDNGPYNYFRVQKFSKKSAGDLDIHFRQQFETELIDNEDSKIARRFYNFRTVQNLKRVTKQKINVLGKLV